MMAGNSLMPEVLNNFVSDAIAVVKFKMIRTESDIEREGSEFSPEFTHQIFGDGENIFGYSGLKVDIFYSACWLSPFIRTSADGVASPSRSGGVEPDDIIKLVSDKLELAFETNINNFAISLQKEFSFKPYGKQIHSFDITDDQGNKENYEVFEADMLVPGFKEYHRYMQSFILWFIDAASYVDVDDLRWHYFVLHERVVENGSPQYFFVGYATAYEYYAYPSNLRPRISQMLILPPYQKKGLGTKMLQVVCDLYAHNQSVVDITVEDPSDSFIRLRDYIDSKNCLKLSSFQPPKLLQGFSDDMRKEAQEKFKICKKQARRVYEILRLRAIDKCDKDQYKAYRLDVKKRLNIPFQRQKLDVDKVKKKVGREPSPLNSLTKEQQIEQLDTMYKIVEAEYEHVIKRLCMST